MKLLSKELVALEYRTELQKDLARAKVCRFLIGYVSSEGINSIGRHLLLQALTDARSFGMSSLTCSCGYEPLIGLQNDLDDIRLKYFMDPLPKDRDGANPGEITLFHSK